MDNPRRPSKAKYVKQTPYKTQPFQSVSILHRILQMDYVLEMIFNYLDIPSLKQCRLTSSSWTPVATRLLMRRTFYNLSTAANENAEDFYAKASLSSIKLNEGLLSRLSSTRRLRSSAKTHWKSISIALIPSANHISSLASFLTSISSSECPQLTNMRINFENDPKFHCAFETSVEIDGETMKNKFSLLAIPSHQILVPEFNPIFLSFNIRSLHLTLRGSTNSLEVFGYLKKVLQKNVVPQLKELLIEFPDDYHSGMEIYRSNPASVTSAMIVALLSEFTEVLRNLRVLKIQRQLFDRSVFLMREKLPMLFLRNAREITKHRLAEVRLDLSSELRELQWGSGFVLLSEKNNAQIYSFFPGVLTQCVASVLETLHFDGVYLSEEILSIFSTVDFPHMPHLKKLTVEAVTIVSIFNFSTLFVKAPYIKEFNVKNSVVRIESWRYEPDTWFLAGQLLYFNKWNATLGPGGYPSLRLLELGDRIYVRYSDCLSNIRLLFPNVEVLKFNCADMYIYRRIPKTISTHYSQFDLEKFNMIEEELKDWKSLRQLTVTYWHYFSANGLLNHLLECADKLPGLQLYDFRQGKDKDPIFCKDELFSELYLNQMKLKLLQLKTCMKFPFVLHNYKLLPQDQVNDGNNRRHSMRSVVNELFKYAEKESILNFRYSEK